jgi:hypothetical protein
MRRKRSLLTRLAALIGVLLVAAGCTGGVSIRYPTFPNEVCESCDRGPI